MMTHGDYLARVTYDEAIDSFFGEVINTADVITFYGRSVEELKEELATSIEVLAEGCRTRGVAPTGPTAAASTCGFHPLSTPGSPPRPRRPARA